MFHITERKPLGTEGTLEEFFGFHRRRLQFKSESEDDHANVNTFEANSTGLEGSCEAGDQVAIQDEDECTFEDWDYAERGHHVAYSSIGFGSSHTGEFNNEISKTILPQVIRCEAILTEGGGIEDRDSPHMSSSALLRPDVFLNGPSAPGPDGFMRVSLSESSSEGFSPGFLAFKMGYFRRKLFNLTAEAILDEHAKNIRALSGDSDRALVLTRIEKQLLESINFDAKKHIVTVLISWTATSPDEKQKLKMGKQSKQIMVIDGPDNIEAWCGHALSLVLEAIASQCNVNTAPPSVFKDMQLSEEITEPIIQERTSRGGLQV